MRLLDLLRRSTDYLDAAGIEDAMPDAETIVFHAVGTGRLDAYVNNPEVTSADAAKVRRLLRRRVTGEPVQYLIGHIEFLGLTINVGKGVLIPRPETEMLVGEAIKAITARKDSLLIARHSSLSVLDLCTGSGCIALALAREFPDAVVIGADLSKEALEYARKNAEANYIRNAMFLQGPLFGPVQGRTFDLITANPPYIKRDEIKGLQREIRDWEPISALDGGEDGMDFYRSILSSAGPYLNPGGVIFLELGYDQSGPVQQLARMQGFKDITVINDYAGLGRVLKGGRRRFRDIETA